MYSIALVAISAAAAYKGDLMGGIRWLSQPGTYDELSLPLDQRTYSVPTKILVLSLFSSMGFFGSSCSAAITKQFGALTMSITSTARKATTLFLSFFLFHNVCTLEHLTGVAIFISALTAKSLRRRGKKKRAKKLVFREVSALSNDEMEIQPLRLQQTESRDSTGLIQRSPSHNSTSDYDGTYGNTTVAHIV
jgi:hypothetical protein